MKKGLIFLTLILSVFILTSCNEQELPLECAEHQNLKTEYVLATCTKDGYLKTYCDDCKRVISKDYNFDLKTDFKYSITVGHKLMTVTSFDKNETVDGVTTLGFVEVCNDCGEEHYYEYTTTDDFATASSLTLTRTLASSTEGWSGTYTATLICIPDEGRVSFDIQYVRQEFNYTNEDNTKIRTMVKDISNEEYIEISDTIENAAGFMFEGSYYVKVSKIDKKILSYTAHKGSDKNGPIIDTYTREN